MTWMVTVEGLILIQQISLGNEAAVDIAIFQVDGTYTLMLDMGNFFPRSLSKRSLKYQQLSVA